MVIVMWVSIVLNVVAGLAWILASPGDSYDGYSVRESETSGRIYL